MTDFRPEPSSTEARRRRIPPLVWIIVAMVVAWLVYAYAMRGGTHVTPQGGTMPQAKPETSYMPPVPATKEAPGTPGGMITYPDAPATGATNTH